MSAWAQLVNTMMQPQGTLPSSDGDDKQKQKEQEEAQKQKQQQDADRMLADHMSQLGAKPVIAGTVYDTQRIPDYSGETEGQDVPIARPADSSRTVKHKSAEGDAVQWELPTPQDQVATRQAQPSAVSSPVQAQPPVKTGNAFTNFFTKPQPGSGKYAEIQREQIEKQQADELALRQHNEDIQNALDRGGKYVGPGNVVQETVTGPDGKPTNILRQAGGEGRFVSTYKNPAGGPDVQLEHGTPEEQQHYQATLRMREAQLAAQGKGAEAQATATGTAAGRTAGALEDLKQRGVKLGPELATRLGMPEMADQIITPEQRDQYIQKIVPVQAKIEGTSKLHGEDNAAKLDREKLGLKSKEERDAANRNQREVIATRNQQLKQWSEGNRAAIGAGLNPNLAAPKLRNFDKDFNDALDQHGQADSRLDKISAMQDLLDPELTPNGKEYKDPLSGAPKKMTDDRRDDMKDMIAAQQLLVKYQRDGANRSLDKLGYSGATAQPTASASPKASSGDGQHSAAATMIANYQSPERTALARIPFAKRQAILQEVLQMNPDYHAEYFNNFNKTESDSVTGKIGTSANALNTMMGHLQVLNTAAEALKNGDVQLLNKVANKFGAATGSTPITVYNTIVHRLGPEVTKAYLAAGGSVGERGTNEADFDSSLGPDQIKQNVGVSALLADSKIKALQDQYQRGTYGRGKQKLMSDEAEAARQTLTKQAPAALRGGIVVTDPKGGKHTFPDQASADKFKKSAGIQ